MEKLLLPYKLNRKFIVSHPNWLFLYGHDQLGRGTFGQAWELHNEVNTKPVYTMYKYCANPVYYMDREEYKSQIDKSFLDIAIIMNDFEHVIPCRKIGEGCSRLKEFAPNLLKYIKSELEQISSSIEWNYAQT